MQLLDKYGFVLCLAVQNCSQLCLMSCHAARCAVLCCAVLCRASPCRAMQSAVLDEACDIRFCATQAVMLTSSAVSLEDSWYG